MTFASRTEAGQRLGRYLALEEGLAKENGRWFLPTQQRRRWATAPAKIR